MPEQPNDKLYTGTEIDPPTAVAASAYGYAELDVTTNYSFLRGASHPDELVYSAAILGHRAMAVTDVNSVAGVVRAYEKARRIAGFRLIVGARLTFTDGTPDLLVWPTDLPAYSRLCQLLTLGRRRAPKGDCHLTVDDFLAHQDGLLAATTTGTADHLRRLRHVLGDRLSLAVSLSRGTDDRGRLAKAAALGRSAGVPLVATNHVHYHHPGRRPLQDVLTCVRHGCLVSAAGRRLFANGERCLKSPREMHKLFADHPAALARTMDVADRCRFDLGQLRYQYPTEAVPAGTDASLHLRQLTYDGARGRYPGGISEKVTGLLEKELEFICGSQYESYFLTVHDLVRFARNRDILCQGRGSAANSAVCYCLGVTAIDPDKFQLVFERFASDARDEPPDIDIDFEHQRREEVIQYVYEKYGRDRAAMTGSFITYRWRSAVRDVGKALGLGPDVADELAAQLDWWHKGSATAEQMRDAGVDPADPTVVRLLELTRQVMGFPRHLSQHVGGMVVARSPVSDLVPVSNAAMPGRTVIEWDKDDLDVLKLFKVDILGLGMLTALSKGMALIDPPLQLHTIPREDPAVYDMLCAADSVGVFQVESRAQMAMLPRLRPRKMYDLVIEVAIVRPGPIQGEMVHPYLQRRGMKPEDIEYERPELKPVLEQTLGVPLFQEQVMRLAIVAAGFTGGEADQLRRAMAAWKRGGGFNKFHDKFVRGMIANQYELEFAERCFKQISGFGEYGFPESHAASFALLVYASAWLKRHHPAAFAAALLNSQPMGFYAPAQLVRDARDHGVEVRPVDVNASEWDCTLEPRDTRQWPGRLSDQAAGPVRSVNGYTPPQTAPKTWGSNGPALRLGFRQIKGVREADANTIVAARQRVGAFTSVSHFHHETGLDPSAVTRLAEADALASLGRSRRPATWDALALTAAPPLPFPLPAVPPAPVPAMSLKQEVAADYRTARLSLKDHPVSFARRALAADRVLTAAELLDPDRCPHKRWAKVAGLVLVRQRPGTAHGIVFITLEDETGVANLVLWADVYDRHRAAARRATLLQADGYVQRDPAAGGVVHLLARRLFDRTGLLADGVGQRSRDFH